MADDSSFDDLPKDKLTEKDLELVKGRPTDIRDNVVKYIAIFYKDGKFQGDQLNLVEKLFKNVSEGEPERNVKKSLAEQLKDCEEPAPRDVIMLLSDDEADVAAPILSDYKHFSTDEVKELIDKSDNTKRSFIAKRKDLKEPMTAVLIETDSAEVVSSLLNNKDAQIQESKYTDILKKFPEQKEVLSALVGREQTPEVTVVKVTQSTTNDILKDLYKDHKERFEQADLQAEESDDHEFLRLKVPIATQTDIVFDRATEMSVNADHIPFLALCMGHVEIFEHLLYQGQNRMPVEEFQDHLSKETGFERLYQNSSFDAELMIPLKLAYRVARETYLHKSPIPREIHKTLKTECPEKLASVPNGKTIAELISKAYDY
jgi:hypothetical protein